ncbi:MAG: PepSY-like domain-containing protein [Prevotellaceae bacterium]|jgi:hypothetical protein|nr:PepSY-like domain-containing protein [Prevotellaceae bacterium]
MKKSIVMLCLPLMVFQFVGAKDFYTKDLSKLPAAAREFVNKHFAKEQISYILIDKENVAVTEYEAVLSGGVEIKFNKKGEWLEIDGNKNKLPDSVVPEEILSHVKDFFPDTWIEKIEREYWGYDVELLNGLDLKFSKKGKLIKIDD